MTQLLWLIPLGLFVGTLGTLIGAGGGFILVPVLLLLYPEQKPEVITSISLAVVFFNALSGSFAYMKMKKVDYKSGLIFSAATIPGSILGAITVSFIPRRIFNGLFGLLLLILAVYLAIRPESNKGSRKKPAGAGAFVRHIIDVESNIYDYSYNPIVGIGLSLCVGFISSLLGIGGGIIHVPALVHLLDFPVHIATATSHFILVFTALSGSLVHLVKGELSSGVIQIFGLAIGVVIGAQIGAKLSKKIHGALIIRSLAFALGLVGLRILFMLF